MAGLYVRNSEEQKRNSNENRSIERLIEDIGNPAEYCFREEWLRWARNPKNDKFNESQKLIAAQALRRRGLNRNIAIACAAIQLSTEVGDEDSRYFSDHGDMQVSMYDRLTMHGGNYRDCVPRKCYSEKKNCDLYCKDLMTNFGYTFRMCIGLLENANNDPIPSCQYSDITRLAREDIGKSTYGPECLNGALFSAGMERYSKDLRSIRSKGCISSEDLNHLEEQLNEFALRCSTLGNFCCIPMAVQGKSRINSYKARGMYFSVEIDGEDEARYVNDQFALFLEWLSESGGKREAKMIARWKRDMLLDCCEGYYKQAAWFYKQVMIAETQEGRISNFIQYLESVNCAIKLRSEQIVKTIKGMQERESTETKERCLAIR